MASGRPVLSINQWEETQSWIDIVSIKYYIPRVQWGKHAINS